MATLSKAKALLIACKALDPFFDDGEGNDLLTLSPTGESVPIPGVRDIEIRDALKRLHKQDQDHGLHAIEMICTTIIRLAYHEGASSIVLSPGELATGSFSTIGELADDIHAFTK